MMMLRCWPAQLLVVAVSSVILLFPVVHGGSLRTTTTTQNAHPNHPRQLLFADFWSNPFQIAGIAIPPEQAESWCDQIWMDFLYCTIRECPDLDEKCPPTLFYSNLEQQSQQPDLRSVDCNAVEKSYCDTYGVEGCCMAECSVEIQNLAACVIKGKGGKKLKCRAHDCVALAEFEALVAAQQAQAEAEAAAAAQAAAEAQAAAAAEAAAQAAKEAEAQAAADDEAAKEAQAAADAQEAKEAQEQQQGQEAEDQTQDTQVGEEGVLLVNAGREEELPFLENFQVQPFANRDRINALNVTTSVSNGFFPMTFVEAMGRIFFQASGDTTGHELWVMNQARKSPRLVKDINPGFGSSLDGMLVTESAELNGNLLFFADNGIHGKQLWKTNGSETGTEMVRQIGGNSNDYFSKRGVAVVHHNGKHSMIPYNGKVYFTLRIDGKGEKLWVTDGTRSGTYPATRDSSSISFPNGIKFNSLLPETLMDGKTYFVASSPSSSESQQQQQQQRNSSSSATPGKQDLYVYVADNSTDSGTTPKKLSQDVKVKENHEELVEFHGKIYFNGEGDTLFSTDGTSSGTLEVVGPNGGAFWFPRSLTVVRNILYFWSDCQLWSLGAGGGRDGGKNTTKAAATFVLLFDGTNSTWSSCSDELVQFHNRVLFRGGNHQPYITDGTVSGTTKLSDATLIPTTSFVVYNNRVAFFAAETSDGFGHDLWATDGTSTNTQLIPGIGINQPGLYPHIDNLFVFRHDVYVSVWYLFGPGDEIWRARISGYEEPPIEVEPEREEEPAGATYVDIMPFEILPSDLQDDEDVDEKPTRLTKLTIIQEEP